MLLKSVVSASQHHQCLLHVLGMLSKRLDAHQDSSTTLSIHPDCQVAARRNLDAQLHSPDTPPATTLSPMHGDALCGCCLQTPNRNALRSTADSASTMCWSQPPPTDEELCCGMLTLLCHRTPIEQNSDWMLNHNVSKPSGCVVVGVCAERGEDEQTTPCSSMLTLLVVGGETWSLQDCIQLVCACLSSNPHTSH